MPWVLVLLIVLVGAGFYLLVYASAQAQLQAMESGAIPPQPGAEEAMAELLRGLRPDRVQSFGLEIVGGLGSVMLIVFAASHVGTEFVWSTLRTLLAHGAGRATFLGAKLLSIALFAVLFMFLGVVAAIAGSYIVTAIAAGDASGLDLAAIANAAARGYYTFLPYMALAALTEGLVAQLLVSLNRDYANVVNYGLSRNTTAITRTVTATTPSGDPSAVALPDPGQAALVLAAYTALFVAIAFWRLRTRDVTLG